MRLTRKQVTAIVIAGPALAIMLSVAVSDLAAFGGAHTVYYDVESLVGESSAFASTAELAAHFNGHFAEHPDPPGPPAIYGIRDRPTLIVWGSSSGHEQFRAVLSDLHKP